jgi:hypothetical protein
VDVMRDGLKTLGHGYSVIIKRVDAFSQTSIMGQSSPLSGVVYAL